MARTVVALFDEIGDAYAAVRDLTDHGFPREDIGIITYDVSGEYSRYFDDTMRMEETSATATGAGTGAGIGAVIGGLGGLLVGLGALVIPGIGPVIAAGPLAVALSGLAGAGVGAVAGGITGGLIGALIDMGIPEEDAQTFAEAVRRGGTLVTVHTDDHMADQARDLLNRHNPVDVNERSADWRATGWTGFDQNAVPMTADEVELERQSYYTPVMESGADYDDYREIFVRHYETSLASTGYPYDYYEPAYRFGSELRGDERYIDRDWTEIEPEVRSEWERQRPGTWEQFKSSIRHAWEEVKDALS